MTLPRVKPSDWAFGEILTSAQMNQLDTNVSNAVDGAGGGTYTLSAPLVINGANMTVGQDLFVGDDLDVADDLTVHGDITFTGQCAGTLVNAEEIRAPSKISLSGGPGWNGAHTIDPDDDKVFIFVDDTDISGNKTWDIALTWRNGSFFMIVNQSSWIVTVNKPSGGSVAIAAGKACWWFKERDIWRAALISPT